MGFVHDEDFETPDFTPQDIRVCKDVDQLREWLSEVEDARDDIKSQIDAAQVTGLIDNDWLTRSRGAYAFASMGAKRVKRRMRELGHTPEPKEEVAELRRVRSAHRRSEPSAVVQRLRQVPAGGGQRSPASGCG